jgi:hypothetical protein
VGKISGVLYNIGMFKKIVYFFDRLEDKVREKLSHAPLLYALIAGTGVVLFWRGIWHTADEFTFLNGPVSLIIGSVILAITGIFVSAFIGNRIILTGLRGEKKLAEKTKEEIEDEETKIDRIRTALSHMEEDLEEIKSDVNNHNDKYHNDNK